MSKRKILDVEVGGVDGYVDFDDILNGKTPDQVIEAAESFKKEYEGRDIYFNVTSYGYDGGKELKLRERRLETDKEFAKRMAEEKKAKAKAKEWKATKEEKERKEYERLKKKFADKSYFDK
jgi:hypothetical protein